MPHLAGARLFWALAALSFRRQLTYRAAALAGLVTNFFFGLLKAAILIALYAGRTEMAGYRNRLTHFYGDVTHEELRAIGLTQLGDVERVLDEILAWLRANPDKLDQTL